MQYNDWRLLYLRCKCVHNVFGDIRYPDGKVVNAKLVMHVDSIVSGVENSKTCTWIGQGQTCQLRASAATIVHSHYYVLGCISAQCDSLRGSSLC